MNNKQAKENEFIYGNDVYMIIKEDGMGVLIMELPHPYKLTHKNYKRNQMRLFCGGFERERERDRLFLNF